MPRIPVASSPSARRVKKAELARIQAEAAALAAELESMGEGRAEGSYDEFWVSEGVCNTFIFSA